MTGLDWSEMLVISLVVLGVFALARLPELGLSAGTMAGKARAKAREYQAQRAVESEPPPLPAPGDDICLIPPVDAEREQRVPK